MLGVTSEYRRWRNYLCEIPLCSHRLVTNEKSCVRSIKDSGGKCDLRQVCWSLANCEEAFLRRTGK